MDTIKLDFITKGSLVILDGLDKESKALWGVMNAQEMIEHLTDFVDISTEKIKVKLYTDEVQLPLYKAFLLSDKVFRQNTKVPVELLGETPLPLKCKNIDEAKQELHTSINDFVEYFKNEEEKQTLHPVFGMLTFNEWVLLHYKHVVHHLKQFGKIDL